MAIEKPPQSLRNQLDGLSYYLAGYEITKEGADPKSLKEYPSRTTEYAIAMLQALDSLPENFPNKDIFLELARGKCKARWKKVGENMTLQIVFPRDQEAEHSNNSQVWIDSFKGMDIPATIKFGSTKDSDCCNKACFGCTFSQNTALQNTQPEQ